jgi:hypothetical protein
MTRTKKAGVVLICVVSLCVFVVPAFIRILMPKDVQRAWETSKVASYTKLTTWLYKPSARVTRVVEELCRIENDRLTNGGDKSEVGKTLAQIRELVENQGANLGLLTSIRAYPQKMTIDELLALRKSTKPIDQYYALQRILQIQRVNAEIKYAQCLGEEQKDGKNSAAGSTSGVIDALQANLREIDLTKVGLVPLLYAVAGVCAIFSLMCARARLYPTSNGLWYIAVIVAVFATILYLAH